MTPFERRLAEAERRLEGRAAGVPVITGADLERMRPAELVDCFKRAIRGEVCYERPGGLPPEPVPTRAQIEAMSPAERARAYAALIGLPPAVEPLA